MTDTLTGRRALAAAIGLVCALAAAARADDGPDERDLDQAKVKAAIDRGVAWLKKQQKPDGRFDDGYNVQFPLGPTALAALALEKCAGPADPAAQRALASLDAKLLKMTYDVGLVMMAVEGRYAPKDEDLAKADYTYTQLLRKAFGGGAAPMHQQLVSNGVSFLTRTQHKEVWGYPFDREEDHSNTQYALLGFAAALRLGLDVPKPGLQKALDHFLKAQEQDGQELDPPFVVPAADHSAKEVEALAAELHKPKVRKEGDGGTTEIRKFYESAAKAKMRARGFGYKTADEEGDGRGGGRGSGSGSGGGRRGGGWRRGGRDEAYLSMTTAGLACLVTLKWALEGTPGYDGKKVDQAIRDAAAYIAQNFRIGEERGHEFYVLYGLERAGAMTGCPFFGTHDWYVEGGEWILDKQNDDGSWGKAGPISGQIIGQPETSVPNTCFALLFLKRGSVPVVPPIPKRIATGDGRGGGN
jgi:hypothetical protein